MTLATSAASRPSHDRTAPLTTPPPRVTVHAAAPADVPQPRPVVLTDEDGVETEALPERIAQHCTWIDKMVLGEAAARILAQPDLIPDHGYVAIGATWWWTTPLVSMGRKGSTPGDSRLVPVRVTWGSHTADNTAGWKTATDDTDAVWAGTPIEIVDSATAPRQAAAAGMGRTAIAPAVPASGTWLSQVRSDLPGHDGMLTCTEIEMLLASIVADGLLAKWAYHEELASFVGRAVATAHSSLAMEASDLHGRDIWRLVDQPTIEQVIDLVSLGDGRTGGQVDKLLTKVTDPDTFLRVEPVHHAARWVNREAKDQLRVVLDDPRIGSKVRAVAREIGSRDPHVVAEAYFAQYGGKRIISADISQSRVHRALRLGQDQPPVSIEHYVNFGGGGQGQL